MSGYAVRRTLPGGAGTAGAAVGGPEPDGWPTTGFGAVVGEQGGAGPPGRPGRGFHFEMGAPPEA